MSVTETPRIREMDRRDINAVLARNVVGRLAFLRGDQLDVLPLCYMYSNGSIYGRTSAGGKLAAMGPDGTTVVFQVDEVASMSRWRSVLAHGTLRVCSADAGREEWSRAPGHGVRRRGDPPMGALPSGTGGTS